LITGQCRDRLFPQLEALSRRDPERSEGGEPAAEILSVAKDLFRCFMARTPIPGSFADELLVET
jgi:hypothetical protein